MTNETYTINIGKLKISGPPEDLYKLSSVYGRAVWDYENLIINEVNSKNNDTLIAEFKAEQEKLKNIEKQIIDTIKNSEYYKKYVSERSTIVNRILDEINQRHSS